MCPHPKWHLFYLFLIHIISTGSALRADLFYEDGLFWCRCEGFWRSIFFSATNCDTKNIILIHLLKSEDFNTSIQRQNNDFLNLFDFFIPGEVARYKVENVTEIVRQGSPNKYYGFIHIEGSISRLYNRFSGNFRNYDVIHVKHRRPRYRPSLTKFFVNCTRLLHKKFNVIRWNERRRFRICRSRGGTRRAYFRISDFSLPDSRVRVRMLVKSPIT